MTMTKAFKRLSIATATAGLLVGSMTGALAQAPADPHHPQGAPAAGAQAPEPAPPTQGVAPMEGGGMEGMMGGGQMPMKMMQEMHEKMMGGGMAMQPKGDAGPSSQAFNGTTAKMHQDMAITFTGNADVDFVKEMIPHHQGAVDMAKTVLAFGKDPEVKKVAEEIISAQEAEITWMKEWLKKQGQ
jgi:uncharacterized protein (DUF305 family)